MDTYYNPERVAALGLEQQAAPLPQAPARDVSASSPCEFHSDSQVGSTSRRIQLTMLDGEPWICRGCLMDVVRDGFINPFAADLRSAWSTTEAQEDGSVASGNVVFAWS